eukprot:TRINITY_DN45347_c0_g1_i3.p1 TRINITY_DN45347_c0_g1~~TRINITY_DN45347_c0_g1_i3.p1  ORF type:complete len:110 (-),score=6.55 TRINITY_DN45347_c0_g1_i3:306-635(-)
MTTFRIYILLVMCYVASSVRLGEEEQEVSSRRLKYARLAWRDLLAASEVSNSSSLSETAASYERESAETGRHCYVRGCNRRRLGWYQGPKCIARCAVKSSCSWTRQGCT